MMKKILAALLVLACVSPALAVSFTATDLGSGLVQISYDATGETLRGVALTVVADGATIAGTDAVTVPTQTAAVGFNTFIDYAYSNATTYDAVGEGHPLAITGSAGALTAFPASEFSLSMGVLDTGSTQAGISDSGVLCTLQFAFDSGATSATITIDADSYRGGAVVGDTGITQPTLPIELTIPNTPAYTIDGTLAVAGVSYVNVTAANNSFTASGVTSTGTLEYGFDWGDGSTVTWSTSATQTHAYSYTAAGTYTISVTARVAEDTTVTSAAATTTAATEAIKSTATEYATWVSWGRPSCWAFKRQCRGDANGGKVGVYWVQTTDLNAFVASYFKTEAVIATVSVNGVAGICTDFNHGKVGVYRVQTADLNTFVSYYFKTEANVPVCDATNFNYYTN